MFMTEVNNLKTWRGASSHLVLHSMLYFAPCFHKCMAIHIKIMEQIVIHELADGTTIFLNVSRTDLKENFFWTWAFFQSSIDFIVKMKKERRQDEHFH